MNIFWAFVGGFAAGMFTTGLATLLFLLALGLGSKIEAESRKGKGTF